MEIINRTHGGIAWQCFYKVLTLVIDIITIKDIAVKNTDFPFMEKQLPPAGMLPAGGGIV